MAQNSELGKFRLIRSSSVKKQCFKLVENGFIYNKQRIIDDITHWQCERKGICKARLHTKGSEIVKRTGEHLHGSDALGVNCLELKAGIKRKARDTHDASHHIIGTELECTSESTAIKLPKIESMKRSIRRERQMIDSAPVQPEGLQDLVIPPEYTFTAKGENFLLFNSGPGTLRTLIFGTQQNVDLLTTSQIWLAAGTFKTAPPLFTQVYTVHGLRGGPNLLQDGHLLPSLFVLLPNKTETTYAHMWEQIKVLCPTAAPTHMIMDFEKAAINAFHAEWPLTTVKGCFFHFTQNIWRKLQALGLQADYILDEQLAIRLRMLPALAFASPFDVPELFPQVIAQLNILNYAELALYFENTYIGRHYQAEHR